MALKPMRSKRFEGINKDISKVFRVQTPWWLSFRSKVWDLYVCNATAGWDFYLRVYNIVSSDSPIAAAIRQGDIASVRRLLASKAASPNDQIVGPYGYLTLLEVRNTI